MSENELGIFCGKDKPDVTTAWQLYEESEEFNTSINLYDTVKTNENFYIGKQWEGVVSNGLPQPVDNFLKRVVGFIVATITTDNITVNATALPSTANTDELIDPVRIVNEEFIGLTERNNVTSLLRKFARNSAVDGDGCLYTYWDPEYETGQASKGTIRTTVIENSRVRFGDPNTPNVEDQPWIQIVSREITRKVKKRAKANGAENWESIADDDVLNSTDSAKIVSGKTTVILTMWRDEDTGEIWAYESTQNCEVKEPYNLGIKRYPINWLPWDYVQDCYHGQAMLTGLIPNQVATNKMWAMSILSLMVTAFPKIIYDKTRVAKWDNRVGAAIGINGGDVGTVAKIIDPAPVSPQVFQLIQSLVQDTEQSLGATAVALGDTRPDNTSAIVALQRAASTPTEITKQNLYQCVEDLYRIYLEFMAEYYGKRIVDVEPDERMAELYTFSGREVPTEVQTEFDFGMLKSHPMTLKLDVGASSYYSEIASIQTLDNLLQNGHITALQYLERIPDGYIPARRALVVEMKQQMAQMPREAPAVGENAESLVDPGQKPEIPTGGGYSDLQRKINAA